MIKIYCFERDTTTGEQLNISFLASCPQYEEWIATKKDRKIFKGCHGVSMLPGVFRENTDAEVADWRKRKNG